MLKRVFVFPLSAGVFPRRFSQRHQGLSHERHNVPDLRTLPQILPQLPKAPGSQLHSSHGPEPRGEQPDSDSEDFSPTPSLAEVSSDDLSWLDDHEPGEKRSELNKASFVQLTSNLFLLWLHTCISRFPVYLPLIPSPTHLLRAAFPDPCHQF